MLRALISRKNTSRDLRRLSRMRTWQRSFTVEIRQAQVEDASEIARINARCWRAAYTDIMRPDLLDKLVAEQGQVDRWQAIIRTTHMLRFTYVVADDQRRLVGCATCGPERLKNPDYTGELYSLYLLPEYQRQGLGRALIGQAAARLLQEGMGSMLVWVLTDNHAARRFYERLDGQWLQEGNFEAGGESLSAVAYGWKEVRPLIQDAFAEENDKHSSLSVWQQRWRNAVSAFRRNKTSQ